MCGVWVFDAVLVVVWVWVFDAVLVVVWVWVWAWPLVVVGITSMVEEMIKSDFMNLVFN